MAVGRRLEQSVIAVSIALLFIAFLHRLYTRGGPYLELPATIVDHVGPRPHDTHDALVALPRFRRLIPRGATVTCFRPVNGAQQYDTPNYLAAVGLLPAQHVVPPFAASRDTPKESLAEYVVAIGQPFTHPAYRLLLEFPEGRLYKVVR